LRPGLPAAVVPSAALEAVPHGHKVKVAGLVVARQRPGTANGVVFLLIEDEAGTVNLVIPPGVYERHRLAVRTEPLIVVEGTLERFAAAGGAINVLVSEVNALEAPDAPQATVRDFSALEEKERRRLEAEKAASGNFRAVAPAVQSFASGRRR
jgi:error-prone DNA polymerase